MNVLFAINDGYAIPAVTMLTSLLENNKGEKHDIYMLFSKGRLSRANIDRLNDLVSGYDASFHAVDIPIELFETFPIRDHFSIETYYRFLIQTYIPKEVDRILWLDADVIVKRSIIDYYHQDFEGKHIVVCRSINENTASLLKKLGMPEDTDYFNAGTILFNLELIRKTIDSRAYFDYIEHNADKITWLDQDVLNVIYADKKKLADHMVYNMMHFYNTEFDEKTREFIDNNTAILHYIGRIKPWHPQFDNYTLKYYRKYARMNESSIESAQFNVRHFAEKIKKIIKKVLGK